MLWSDENPDRLIVYLFRNLNIENTVECKNVPVSNVEVT